MKAKKAKQNLPSDSQASTSEKQAINFKQGYFLKGNTLEALPSDLLLPVLPVERKFKTAKELEQLVLRNGKTLFGQQTFIVLMPKKTAASFGKESVPNSFLLDVGDLARPKFYFLDIMLAKQSFFGYVFPRLTKFFSYFKSQETIDKLCELISKDKEVRKELLAKMKPADIPLYLKAAVLGRPFILLVMDGDGMKELPEVMETYSSTWQLVKPVLIRKYASNGKTICIMSPSFSEIHSNGKKRLAGIPLTEADHLKDTSENVREIYNKVKAELLKINNQLQFNSQKYYISLRKNKNLAFFHFSSKRISLVVMNPEKDTKKQIKHHEVKTLTEKVQKFWNGPSCTIKIENVQHLNEVIALLKKLITA